MAHLERWAKINLFATMGAWANDPFGNDTACDWKYGLDEVDDLSLIEATIQRVLDAGDEYLEAPSAEEAIAAADTIARLKGKFYERNAYTESVDQWVDKHRLIPPPRLVAAALQAIDRIEREPSELLELWSDSDDFAGWAAHLTALRERLR